MHNCVNHVLLTNSTLLLHLHALNLLQLCPESVHLFGPTLKFVKIQNSVREKNVRNKYLEVVTQQKATIQPT